MVYDLIIVGSGPAGLTAGIYASRAKLKTLIIESLPQIGGQVATTTEIENWPGQITTGSKLMQTFKEHCLKFGNEFYTGEVTFLEINENQPIRTLHLSDGKVFQTKTIILATGAEPRILGIPGEKEFRGQGVSYCATCDGEFYSNLDIVCLGSGNTSLEESVFLTRFANKVTIVVLHEEGKVDGSAHALEKAQKNPKISFIWNSTVSEIYGSEFVEGVKLKNLTNNEITDFKTDGIFMFVGIIPKTQFVKNSITLSQAGYIIVNQKMETNIAGVFAAGDATDKILRQIVTATSDGAIAAVSAQKYIENHSW